MVNDDERESTIFYGFLKASRGWWKPGKVGNWKITLEFQVEPPSLRKVGLGVLFTLRMFKRIERLFRTIYQGGTAGIKPSRPYFGMRGFFCLSIGYSLLYEEDYRRKKRWNIKIRY
ncbi:hypothetical protein COE25_13855 [Bacillus sp. AFS031507]|nr:hypothetical protein COE25_13855 [Bacillus sp. AFS031507]